MEIALLTTKNGNLLLLYPTLILMGRKSTHNWPTHVWLLVRILKMRAEFVWSLFIGVIKSCFIFILSNSTSFTIWSSQFAFSTRSNWTGNSNGTWTDKQSTTCKIRQSKINSRSVAGLMGQMNRRPSVWCSKYYFFMISCRILCKNTFNLFLYFFF